jgi:hypothetical protein
MPFSEIQPLLFAALILSAALWYYRYEAAFRTLLGATLFMIVYCGVYTVLMYLAAGVGAPLVDYELMRLDALMGVHLPSIVKWAAEHPTLNLLLNIAYASVAVQTGLVLVFSKNPWAFVQRFVMGSLACLAVFIVWPAAGPFVSHGYPVCESQAVYLAHLEGLRSGWMHICVKNAQGLITVPSFHVIWAVFLAAAARGWVRPLAYLLNAAVIAATLTTGWHYGADVVSGLLVAVVILLLTDDK